MSEEKKAEYVIKESKVAPAATALDQFRRLEAESLEEENTERGRFFDTYERLGHALSLVRQYLLSRDVDPTALMQSRESTEKQALPPDDRATILEYRRLREILERAVFPNSWASETVSTKMSHKEAAAYQYQLLNAKGRMALSDARALLIHLGILPSETSEEMERRMDLEAVRHA